MARIKKTIISDVSTEQMEQAFCEFATADAKIQKLNADMDIKITGIREGYAVELQELQKVREDNLQIVQAYAMQNKETVFSKKKSMECAHGTIGFRTGTPKLKASKGFTWVSVLAIVKKALPAYVRTNEEVAKDKILADREKKGMAEKLKECGIEVVQDEAFFIDPKKEEAPASL